MLRRTISFMGINSNFSMPPAQPAPSEGDGASHAKPHAQMDTSGANGGLGQSEAGAADIASYRAAQSQYSRFDGDGAGGTTI
jgi:hypothetical protein